MRDAIEIRDADAKAAMTALIGRAGDLRPFTRAISQALQSRTEANFAAQSGPGGPWQPLAAATLKRRGAGARILQDRGRLAASVTPFSNATEAGIGSNVASAAIHQLGGDIERAAYSSWARLRTSAAGDLLRQGDKGRSKNLAVFAKGKHKRAKTVRYTTGPYKIHIPARPYMPVYADGRLQEGFGGEINEMLSNFLLTGKP